MRWGRVALAGKPLDAIVIFKMLILQALDNLSDEQVDDQVRDRLSFTRFLRLGIEDSIPDATPVWLFSRLGSLRSCLTALTAPHRQRLHGAWRTYG
jgi:IS5 family transposase